MEKKVIINISENNDSSEKENWRNKNKKSKNWFLQGWDYRKLDQKFSKFFL